MTLKRIFNRLLKAWPSLELKGNKNILKSAEKECRASAIR